MALAMELNQQQVKLQVMVLKVMATKILDMINLQLVLATTPKDKVVVAVVTQPLHRMVDLLELVMVVETLVVEAVMEMHKYSNTFIC